MNYIFLLLFFEVLLFLLAFILNKNDIMAPSVMMCAMFVVSTLFAIANIEDWNIKYSLESCLILSSGLLTYLLAETFFRLFFERRRRKAGGVTKRAVSFDGTVSVPRWMIFAVILFDTAVLAAYFLRIRSITGLSGFDSMIFSTYRAATTHLESRVNTDVEQAGLILNQLLKAVRSFGFAAEYIAIKNVLGGEKLRQQAGMFTIVFLAVCAGLLVASRGIAVQLIAAGLAEYSIVWHQKYGWKRNLSWKIIRIGTISLLLGIPLFHFTAELIGESTKLNLFQYASVYLGTPIQLFDVFVRSPSKPTVFGEESLVGIRQFLEYLGFPVYTRDINLEFTRLNHNTVSNVYTFFRRPLHDFGFWGMLGFTVLVAMLFTWLYYHKIKWKPVCKKVDYWTLVYGYYFYWIFISSIDQISQFMIAFNGISTAAMNVIAYMIMTKLRLRPLRKHIRDTGYRRTIEN